MADNQHDGRIAVGLIIHSLCYGGAERQVVEIARNLDRARFRVNIITFSDFTPLLKPDDELRKSLIILPKPSKFDVTVVWRLYKLLKGLRIDVAHAFLFDTELATRLASRLAGVRFVIGSERNADYELAKWRWILLRMTLPLTHLIIANSNSGATYHASLYGRHDQRYEVVHNGVDTERFHPRPRKVKKQELGFCESNIVIGMFASFKRQKNHILLFEALKDIVAANTSIRLILAGDNLLANFGDTLSYKAEVHRALNRCGLTAITTILGNRTDVESIYAACDMTVLPSLHEGTPNVVLESMACGTPVILTDVSDNASLVKHKEEGLLVRPGNFFDLRHALDTLCNDRELRESMGRAARRGAVDRSSNATMSKKIGNIYAEPFDTDIEDF